MLCSGVLRSYITFEDVRVPVSHLIGSENEGFRYVMYNFNHERWSISIQASRFARVCLEEAMRYAFKRRTFGKLLIEHPVIRLKLAHMARQVEASHALMESITYQLTQMDYDEAVRVLGGPIALAKAQVTTVYEYWSANRSHAMSHSLPAMHSRVTGLGLIHWSTCLFAWCRLCVVRVRRVRSLAGCRTREAVRARRWSGCTERCVASPYQRQTYQHALHRKRTQTRLAPSFGLVHSPLFLRVSPSLCKAGARRLCLTWASVKPRKATNSCLACRGSYEVISNSWSRTECVYARKVSII